jgi:hypothetical protein
MTAPPDDLTAWRPDDGPYDEAMEITEIGRHLIRSINGMSDFGFKCSHLIEADAMSVGLSLEQWCALPKPRRDMLLQRHRAPRKA